MAVRYYPSSKIIPNLSTAGSEFSLDGNPYSGKYYVTYSGEAFTGVNPQSGKNQKLSRIVSFSNFPGIKYTPDKPDSLFKNLPGSVLRDPDKTTRISGRPNSYYPQPIESDYKRGYIIRYFTKKINERGFIIEISENEYSSIVNGTVDYDISIYQTTKILWKITGPLNSQRQSQYNVIPGIIDTNQRLTEAANKTFLGIVDFIDGDYTRFVRPTS